MEQRTSQWRDEWHHPAAQDGRAHHTQNPGGMILDENDGRYHHGPLMDQRVEENAPQKGFLRTEGTALINTRESTSTIREHVDSNKSICTWLPKGLRWPFLTFLVFVTLGLAFLVLGLMIYSERHDGLGNDRDSAAFLFGWRFGPTLLAVLYGILLMTLLHDIKRTIPYERLSRPNGGSAESTLFVKQRKPWLDPFDALNKRRNNGKLDWALFWASIANLLALLIISPFSAALLAPAEVLIAQDDVPFSRLIPSQGGPISLPNFNDETIFRTISSVLLNTTTSAWLTDNYAILPFWPSTQRDMPLGAVLTQSRRNWTADTTVYHVDFECKTMKMESFKNFSMPGIATDAIDNFKKKIPINANMTSFLLKSDDGCSFEYSATIDWPVSNLQLWFTGGGWWSEGSNFSHPEIWKTRMFYPNGNTSLPNNFVNISSECGTRSMFWVATPNGNGTKFEAEGHICSTKYYSASLPVTVFNDGSASIISFDTDLFDRSKAVVGPEIIDILDFERNFRDQDWVSKFKAPDESNNPSQLIRPRFAGPLVLIGSQSAFSIVDIIGNKDIAKQARRIKQRMFGENLQAYFSEADPNGSVIVSGTTNRSERRVVVNLVVGVLLIVTLFLSMLVILGAMFCTRLSRRPLNLLENPTSAGAIASLVQSEPNTRLLFEGMDQSSEEEILKRLEHYQFYLKDGVLHARLLDDAQQTKGKTGSPYLRLLLTSVRHRIP